MLYLYPNNNRSFRLGESIISPSQSQCAIIGDQIEIHNNKINVTKRGWISNLRIPGVIIFISKYRYGYNKSGLPFYLFNPSLPYLPPMIVACKGQYTDNMLAIVEFNTWINPSEHPRANLVQYIGPVNSIDDEAYAIIHRVIYPNYKRIEEFNLPALYLSPLTTSKFTFNIDPKGCIDIDDVLTIFPLCPEGDIWQIDISIADVSRFVPIDSPIDLIARRKTSTAYTELLRDTMLPEFLEKQISITEDSIRYVITLSIVWNKLTKTIEKTEWLKNCIYNSRSFSYEDAQDYSIDDQYLSSFNILREFTGSHDSHIWVEYVMRLYNKEAAKIIREIPKAVFRHESKPEIPPEVPDNLRFLYYNSSKYSWEYTEYTHASSPIRRYADIIAQRAICSFIDKTPPPKYEEDLVEWLNYKQKVIRQCERDILFYKRITTGLNHIEGIIASIDLIDDLAKIRVWFPEILHSITVKYRMVDNHIISKDESKSIPIKLYSKIGVTILWDTTKISGKRFIYSLFD